MEGPGWDGLWLSLKKQGRGEGGPLLVAIVPCSSPAAHSHQPSPPSSTLTLEGVGAPDGDRAGQNTPQYPELPVAALLSPGGSQRPQPPAWGCPNPRSCPDKSFWSL